MKRILLASGAALGLAGTASAADLAVQELSLVPVFTWSGCYLGANAGWIGEPRKVYHQPMQSSQFYAMVGAPLTANNLLTHSYKRQGLRRGRPAASLAASGNGVPGSSAASGISSGADLGKTTHFSFPADYRPGHRLHVAPAERNRATSSSIGSRRRVRASATQFWDRVLLYGTGRPSARRARFLYASRVHKQHRVTCSFTGGAPCAFGAYRQKRIGWTAVGGFEWAFTNNWTVKAEFLYLDFGSFDYISPVNSFSAPPRPPVGGIPVSMRRNMWCALV